MESTERQRWARPRPAALRPRTWYPVLARNLDCLRPEPLEGYVWLEVQGRARHVWAEHLEMRED